MVVHGRVGLTIGVLTAVVIIGGLTLPVLASEPTFVTALDGLPTTLDPSKSNSIQDYQVTWLLHDALTQISADGQEILPSLAERWEKSEDGLTYTFHLRRNLQFHDGSPVDAEAVKVSYERQYLHTSPYYTSTPPNPYEKILAGLVKEIRVLGPHTVAITTHYAHPRQFAFVSIQSPQALRQHSGDLSRTPVGTGPFRLDRWEGNEITLAPFAQSWRGLPKVRVRFIVRKTDAEMVERLAAGEIDLFTYIPSDFFEQLRANSRVTLVKFGGLNSMFVGMQLDRPALNDHRIREAIVRAVNRDRLAAVLGRGAMIPAKSVLPPNCAGFDSAVSQPAYDFERARTLLKEAGATSGLHLRLLYFNPIELWSEVAHAVAADLEKVGISVELARVPSWKDYHLERAKGNHDLYLYSWSVAAPEPERFLYPLFFSQSSDNFGHLASTRIDKLLMEARQPMEGQRRLQLYREVNRLAVEQIPALFLVHRIGVAGVNNRVRGLQINSDGFPQDKLASVEIR